MNRASRVLALAVVGLWAVVYLATQVATRPPLAVEWTLVAGVVLSTIAIVGYPSFLRGPRTRRRSGTTTVAGTGDTIAVMSRHLPHLRQGLTEEAAARTAELIRPLLGGAAVAVTDTKQVLAFAGPPTDGCLPGAPLPDAARRTIATGRPVATWTPAPCVTAPLEVQRRVVGTLAVHATQGPPEPGQVEGLAGLLSLHLELAELDRQAQLAADARLDALRAQINPHFLFNTLNTIASKARSDPDEARQLLQRLSDFFRYSIRQDGQFAEFAQEYFFVRTYLALEQARFGDRLRVCYDVDPQVLAVQVPVLTIQPLVENSVKHGLSTQVGGGQVVLRARIDPLAHAIDLQVRDDGVGMSPTVLAAVLAGEGRSVSSNGGGTGLANISARLDALFGDRYRMDVRSRPGEGTTVALHLPLR